MKYFSLCVSSIILALSYQNNEPDQLVAITFCSCVSALYFVKWVEK